MSKHTVTGARLESVIRGGFHNSRSISVLVPTAKYTQLRDSGLSHKDAVLEALNAQQRAKLARRFCGITGCTCGGPLRADFE